ncbi:3-deoxy-D-manno-octulosonic acid transferase [Phenylobacterium sp.]|uniref:3-deoxy-D-manno-octulosonic acid transferase n=1 Tax=Phenylobacterium sp. TaxID=1871053 RepID=UPI0035AF9D2B
MSRLPATLPLGLYRIATALAEPLAGPALRARARRGKEDAERLTERLGRIALARPAGPLVWLHGVSVGESLSLLPLIRALQARRPDVAILVTSGTVTSARLLAHRLPEGVIHQFAPVDAPGAVRRFLDHWRPDVGVLVESELWPNLIAGARTRGVRLALVSARMTDASARGWGRAPATARALLSAFDLVLPQDEATGRRLATLGARVGSRLNLKMVGAPLPFDPEELAALRGAAGGRPVVLAASTHPGEEHLIADAVRDAGPSSLLVVAPRHPERGAAVAADLAASGWTVARRAAGEPIGAAAGAYVADTLGELGLFFELADVVVMGGGFAPGVGGHNPLEPARHGRPIVTGPEVFNAADTYREMFSEAAAIEARDAAELSRHVAGLLANPRIARRIGGAAQAYAARQGEALDAALALLEPLLP